MQKRRSRMHRTAIGKHIALTPRDLELMRVLGRYRYLRSNFLHAFVGGASEKRFKERLGLLYHDGRYIDRPAQQWQFANCRYMPVVYELDDAGARLLRDHGQDTVTGLAVAGNQGRAARQFAHTLMISEILASIELGVRSTPGLRYISAQEIIAKAPDRTRHSGNPLAIPASISYDGLGGKGPQHANFKLVPDALFGLEYGHKSYRFFALEADRNTMPCSRSDLLQSSYHKKLLAYRAIAAGHLYKTHWGIPNLLVLTVTTNETHMRNIMTELKALTGGSTMFLFKALADFGDLQRAPSPCPQLLTDPWLRVGHEPMNISI